MSDHSETEINHHAARLTAKVIDADAHTMLKTWVDGLDTDEDVEELVDRIYGAAEAEIVETLKREGVEADMDDNEPRYVTDGGQPEAEIEHTLMIVEEDGLDDPEVYQVAKLEHPPDSKQAEAVEGAMCQLVEEAEEETGNRHRFVKESGSPDLIATHYKMHEGDLGEVA